MSWHEGEWEDIGHGVRIKRVFVDDKIAAIDYEHPAKGSCDGKNFRAPVKALHGTQDWRVESEQPLTLSPSLLCPACGHHGFIREGKWVPA